MYTGVHASVITDCVKVQTRFKTNILWYRVLLIRGLITGIKTVDLPTRCQMQSCYFMFLTFPRSYREKHSAPEKALPPRPLLTLGCTICVVENTFSLFPSSPDFLWLSLHDSWHSVPNTRMVLGWKKFSKPEGQTPATIAGLCSNLVFCVCIMCSYHKSPLSGTGAAVAELRNVLEQSVCSLHTLEWDPSGHLHPGLLSEPLLCRVLSGVTEQERPRWTQRFSSFCPEGPSAGTLIGLRASGRLSAS